VTSYWINYRNIASNKVQKEHITGGGYMDAKELRRLPVVGIEEHDREHQEILDTINAIQNVLCAKGTEATKRRIVRAALDSVVTYMRNHFAVEENLMKESAYPGYLKHKEEHESFLTKVEVMQGKMHVISLMPSVESLNMLCNWLHHHILESDKPLLPHLVNTTLVHPSMPDAERANIGPAMAMRSETPRPSLNESRIHGSSAS
jgi:hemerythrin